MAVIVVPAKISNALGKSLNEIARKLTLLGYPSEIVDGNLEVEVTPNRPDLYSYTGILRYLRAIFYEEHKKYSASSSAVEVVVENVNDRPYIAVGIARGTTDKEGLFNELIDFQEKLHLTFGRKRKKVAIGIHDFSKIVPPLRYTSDAKARFVPLDMDEELSASEILERHEKGKMYRHLIKKDYPMIYDQKGVISFPPIINSQRTAISEETEDFLIEVTGTNEQAVGEILTLFLALFEDRGAEVEVARTNVANFYTYKEVSATVGDINRLLGTNFSENDIQRLLKKVGIKYENGNAIIPPYRIDFMDWTDVAEEVVNVYGYDNLTPQELSFATEGKTEYKRLKDVFTQMGFHETYTFFLGDGKYFKEYYSSVLEILNPLTSEITALRPGLEVSLLKVEARNKMKPLPHKFFEIGHVYRDKEYIDVAFLIVDKKITIEELLAVMKRVSAVYKEKIEISPHRTAFTIPQLTFAVRIGKIMGYVGIVKPEVCEEFGIPNPVGIGVLYDVYRL